MKFTNLYIDIIALVKTKHDISLCYESRQTKKDSSDTFTNQTHIFIHDDSMKQVLLLETYNDDDPNEWKRITKDMRMLERKLWSPNKSEVERFKPYLNVYKTLIDRSKQHKSKIFKMVLLQLNKYQTAWSLEDLNESQTEARLMYVDEDQKESFYHLGKTVEKIINGKKTETEKDDKMDIIQ